MLVLSRRETERIRLGKSIVVTVVRVSGDKVRLGIEAPPDVLVLREELQPHEQTGRMAVAAEADVDGADDSVVTTELVAEFEVKLPSGVTA